MTDARTDKRFFWFAGIILALGTLALYWPVTGFPFACIDDGDYITNNLQVQAGLTWPGLIWAFDGIHVANWHPLTWLSHMLDCQLFGLNAGRHHLVNLLFHIANTLLLFTFLRQTTGANWRSASVAALFAWHPLHVESVVWLAERKDVLNAFFWLLTLLTYAHYARLNAAQNSRAKHFYVLAVVACAGAMLSKPMAVTLPFTLILLDYWPLQRAGKTANESREKFTRLLLEKIPFLLLTCALCAATLLAQRSAGSVSYTEWSGSLGRIPVAYVRYLSKTFWPVDLSIIYPYVDHWPAMVTFGSSLLLLLISGLTVVSIRQRPWLAVGWLWFLGTLVPVIGFVQVGLQSMADRYTYIPSIGLFIAIVWSTSELARHYTAVEKCLPFIGGAVLAGCVMTTAIQISYWQNNVKLFVHAVDTTTDNFFALDCLGCAVKEIGRREDAIKIFEESVRLRPCFWPAQKNLAITLLENNQPAEAIRHYDFMAGQLPNDTDERYQISLHLLQFQQVAAAQKQLEATLKANPDFAEGHDLLGAIYLQQSKLDEAIQQFSQASKIKPAFAEAQFNLGLATLKQGRPDEALLHYRAALRLAPNSSEIKNAIQQLSFPKKD